MASFTYTARDRTGTARSGVIDAKHVAEARESLRGKDLFVTNISEKSAAKARSGRKKKVKLGDMVVMSRQLATLVRAGLSIIECLHTVGTQTENATLSQ